MIKYLIMDVDGTLTDGKIYMGPSGEAMKAFSVKDGYVINFILKPTEIIPIIITARKSSIVQNRCDELGITEVYQGKMDKFQVLKEIIGEQNFRYCAYFGDDILDLKCMIPIKQAGGIVACPIDAVQEVKAIADYVCLNRAGDGALREFAEWLVREPKDKLNQDARIKEAISYLKKLDVEALEQGKYIVNDDFYYMIQEYETRPEELCELESHKEYIDIQMIVSGYECMKVVDISRLMVKKDYDKNSDIMFWHKPSNMLQTILMPGTYIVLYPENAHCGCIAIEKAVNVKKIVGKIKK